MAIEFKKTTAVVEGVGTVEEAETLLEWLQANPRGRLNLKGCHHLHGAVIQVLLAARPVLSVAPEDPDLARWLLPALSDPASAETT